jgi:hypothetical protein
MKKDSEKDLYYGTSSRNNGICWSSSMAWFRCTSFNDLTPTQMMQKAELDWKVREVESFIEFDGKKMPTGQKSLVRETDGKIS